MAKQGTGTLGLLKAAFTDFGEDECSVRAAALAYYVVFALPPLLILLIMVAGLIWDPTDVQRAIETQFAGMMGESGAQQIHQMIALADRPGSGGIFATIASGAGLAFGATGAFLQLQGALNRAWEVKPDPKQGGIKLFLTKRLLSLGMVLSLGFLLAVSLALTAGISAVGGMFGGGALEPVLHVLTFVVSFAVLALLFAAMFKFLPDADVSWRDVLVGGAVTGLLFVAGKFAIGFYLGRSSPGDAFGAAAALAVILVWAYYSAMILLFGAEFTQQWAKQRGSGIRPEKGAVRVVEREDVVRDGAREPARGGKGETGRSAGRERGAGHAAAQRGAPGPAESGGVGKALLGVPIVLLLFGRKGGDRPASK